MRAHLAINNMLDICQLKKAGKTELTSCRSAYENEPTRHTAFGMWSGAESTEPLRSFSN